MASTSINLKFPSHSHCNSPFSSSSSSLPRLQISLFLSPPHSHSDQIPKKICYSSGQRSRLPSFSVNCRSMAAQKPLSDSRMLVFVPSHPLIKHWVSVLRNEQTPCPIFKNAMSELGRLLMYEASRDWLPTISGEIQTPMDVAQVEFIDPREPVAVIPILRAGLALAEHATSILPATKTYHLGVSRDEETLQPTVYLNKFSHPFRLFSTAFCSPPTSARTTSKLNLRRETLIAGFNGVEIRCRRWHSRAESPTDLGCHRFSPVQERSQALLCTPHQVPQFSLCCRLEGCDIGENGEARGGFVYLLECERSSQELLHKNDSFMMDDLILSTLHIVFQRLDRLGLATSCYEYACGKLPSNLDLMMGLFNCYVRDYSYVKQEQVADDTSLSDAWLSSTSNFGDASRRSVKQQPINYQTPASALYDDSETNSSQTGSGRSATRPSPPTSKAANDESRRCGYDQMRWIWATNFSAIQETRGTMTMQRQITRTASGDSVDCGGGTN